MSSRGFVILGGLVFAVALGIYVLGPVFRDGSTTDQDPGSPAGEEEALPEPESDRPDRPLGESDPDRPRVAIVIDDLGYEMGTVETFESISQDLTMAVIPDRPYSDELYERWKNEFEFLVHMPMEPRDFPEVDPGENALFLGMNGSEIRRRVRQSLRRYPSAVGMNNHMGSAFTGDAESMRHVLRVLSEEGMFFLDSNTTRDSVVSRVASELNVPVGVNRVFLDNVQSREHIAAQLETLIDRARREGQAIGIGHVQSMETARVLADRLPDYEEEVQFVPVSEIITGSRAAPAVPLPDALW